VGSRFQFEGSKDKGKRKNCKGKIVSEGKCLLSALEPEIV